jgi:membrane protein implicated in regulation of membrane protease activity
MVFVALVWLVAGVLLIVAEIISGDLVLLMLGAAALAASGSAAFGLPWWADVIVFAVAAFGLVGFARPGLRHRLHSGPALATNSAALVGRQAVVVSTVDSTGGRVRIEGEVWSARALSDGRAFESGESVTVVEIAGATAVVWGEF